MFYTDEKYIIDKGVFFIFEDEEGEPRHFLLDIAVLEKLSGKKKIQVPETTSFGLLFTIEIRFTECVWLHLKKFLLGVMNAHTRLIFRI